MTEPETTPASDETAKPLDPKEAMRAALDAKKSAQHARNEASGGEKSMGATHAKAAGKRQFRRKSGG